MTPETVSISLVWALPFLGALAVRLLPGPTDARARAVAVAAAALTALVALAVFFGLGSGSGSGHAFARTDAPVAPMLLGVRYHVGVDGLSAVLLPLTAALSLCILVAAPRAELTRRAAAQILLAEGSILGALVSLDLLVLTLFWTLSLVPLRSELRRRGERACAAAFDVVFIGSTLPLLLLVLALGVLSHLHGGAAARAPYDLVALGQSGVLRTGAGPLWLGGLVLFAALTRIGCFPLHVWIPPLGERGPGPLAMVTFATPLGMFLLARVLLPLFPELCARVMPWLLPLGLLSAAYGAVVALGQHDLRRMLGYFWVSQQGFLLVGIAAWNAQSVSGALLYAIGAVVARTGLLILAAALAARTGTADLRLLGGLVGRAPRMATAFLLLCAAAIGFPGTIGFVAEDLLVQGLLRSHGAAAVALLLVTALDGIVLFRAYQATFLGEPAPHGEPGGADLADLRPRERAVAAALVLLLVVFGFAAAPLLAIRQGVVDSLKLADVRAEGHGPRAGAKGPGSP